MPLVSSCQRQQVQLLLIASLLLVGSSVASERRSCFPDSDIYLEEGSALELYCYVDPTREDIALNNAFGIVFYHKNGERINGQFVSTLNDTTAKLYFENVNESDEYLCKQIVLNPINHVSLANESGSPIFREDELCTYKVVVGHKPLPIEQFSCLSHDWNTLNCSWTKPTNNIETTYRVGYVLPSLKGKNTSYNCPDDDDVLFNRCSWTLHTDPPYRGTFKFFNFLITGHNALGDLSQKIAFDHYSRMVTSPPRNLTVVNKTSTSVFIKWTIGVFCVFDDGMQYKITYNDQSNPANVITNYYDGKTFAVASGPSTKRYSDEVAYNVTDLRPDTQYSISVSMKVAPAEESLWSLPSSINETTNFL